MRIDLEGALAGLLHLAAVAKAAAAGVEFAAAMAERTSLGPDAVLQGTAIRSAEATSQNDEEAAPFEAASGLRRKTQGTLVAGAGLELRRTEKAVFPSVRRPTSMLL